MGNLPKSCANFDHVTESRASPDVSLYDVMGLEVDAAVLHCYLKKSIACHYIFSRKA